MLFTLAVPLQSFAAGMDQTLENVIKIAKTKFQIPADYKFESSISTDGTKKVFFLSWRSKDTTDGSSINVRINEDGTIMGYDKYSPSDYTQTKKLPKISRQDAKVKADGYIKMINPALLPQIKYEENTQNNIMDSNYYLNYYRVVNGVPFYNNTVNVNVNRETGALQSYNLNWTDGLTFPAPGKQINASQAMDAYVNNLGLKLIYKYVNTEDAIKVYAVYTPKYDNTYYAVDAFTGDRLRLDYGYYGPYYDRANSSMKMELAKSSRDQSAVTLNPDELKAVQDASKLKSVEEAEKTARDAKFLGLNDEFKLTSYNLNTNWPIKGDYIWNLYFNKTAKDDTGVSEYISISINAATGVICSFYRSVPNQQGIKPKYDLAASKTAVDAFLLEYYPDILKQVKYDELATENNIRDSGIEKPQNFYLIYNRIVNGIAFPDNGLNINYDAVSGIITNFNLNWFNVDFPAVNKVISVMNAYDRLFVDIGMELEYKSKMSGTDADKLNSKTVIDLSQLKPEMKLTYSLNHGKPLFINANSGIILDYDGNQYKESKKVTYTDISGNSAEKQIMVLAENGIYLEGTQFKPSANIIQKDFLIFLSKTLNYYGPVLTATSNQKDIDNLYSYMIREGILKTGEKAPESAITKEDAVKFIIRAMKYDKVADIKGIYTCPFKDASKIGAGLTGYVTIAAGLNIISGTKGCFNPKAKLTRADAAIMIYNYLQV
jgi:hypothetical protein